MSEITSKLAEIRERHEAVTGYFGEGGTAAHWDRDTLLRLAELLLGAQQYSDETRAALGDEIEAAEKRIAELEAELEANQQSWQEHDQLRLGTGDGFRRKNH
jgi:transposase